MADTELHDKWNINYFTYMLHGIGILLPWNMFMVANAYFMGHKLTGTAYELSYLNYVTFFSQIPNVSFNWLNIYVKLFGGDMSKRIVWSLGINIMLFIVTILLAMIDTSSWKVAFFWITMLKVFLMNACTGVYQNTIFGMAAKLPFKFTGVILFGNNFSGVFATIMKMIFDQITSNVRISATYFFLSAIIVQLMCFVAYFAMPINKFFRETTVNQMKEEAARKTGNEMTERPPYLEIFLRAMPQCINVGVSFFVTLAIFPALQVSIASTTDHLGNLFTDITCFATFNIMATIGSLIPKYFLWPKPKYLWIPVVVRISMIPFFFFCNYNIRGRERNFGYLFGDYIYWIGGVVMALTGGYLTTVAMIYVAITADPKYASVAGQFGAACLITGIFLGICVTFAWPVMLTSATE